jgi:hypothetical protein
MEVNGHELELFCRKGAIIQFPLERLRWLCVGTEEVCRLAQLERELPPAIWAAAIVNEAEATLGAHEIGAAGCLRKLRELLHQRAQQRLRRRPRVLVLGA